MLITFLDQMDYVQICMRFSFSTCTIYFFSILACESFSERENGYDLILAHSTLHSSISMKKWGIKFVSTYDQFLFYHFLGCSMFSTFAEEDSLFSLCSFFSLYLDKSLLL